MDKSVLNISPNVGFLNRVRKYIFYKSREFLQSSADIFFFALEYSRPIPVAERSKAWFYGRSPAGIVGSNSAEDMDVCL